MESLREGRVMASFTTSAESLKARLHLSHIPTPLLAGCALLVFGVVAGVGVWLFGLSSTPAFSVETGSFDQGVSFGEAAQGENGAARAAAEVQENSEVGESGRKGVVAAADAAAEALAADKGHALVHVTGAVECPGVYRVAVGARVQDAVDAAGGVTGDAASDAVNMARPVADGEQVRVPTQEEVQANPAGVVQQAVEEALRPLLLQVRLLPLPAGL